MMTRGRPPKPIKPPFDLARALGRWLRGQNRLFAPVPAAPRSRDRLLDKPGRVSRTNTERRG